MLLFEKLSKLTLYSFQQQAQFLINWLDHLIPVVKETLKAMAKKPLRRRLIKVYNVRKRCDNSFSTVHSIYIAIDTKRSYA